MTNVMTKISFLYLIISNQEIDSHMKIYFLLPDLSAGGAERVSITIARILKNEGFDVEFVNIGFNSGEMKTWIEPEFAINNLNCNRVLSGLPKLIKFMELNNGLYFSSREHVSVVSLLAAKITNRKIIIRIPNMPNNILTKGISGVKMKFIKLINHHLLKSAKIVIAQNEEMREQLLCYYHLTADKVVTINNPVDKEYVQSSAMNSGNPFNHECVNFLNVCNISYAKGIDTLIAAWPKVKAAIPNAHMNIVGRNTSDYAKEIVAKARGLSDFTFLGFQNNPYPFLKYCDVFVLPSRMEGFPNVLLEAQCFNRPVVSTTCVSVITDIIREGENGYFCKVEDPNALADCMIKASRLRNINNSYDLFDRRLLLNCFK